MKWFLAVALLLFSTVATSQTYMFLPIVEVYDGDTIKSTLGTRLPIPLNKVSVRINNIDTPEISWRAQCPQEQALAVQAKDFVISLTEGHKKMTIRNYKWDKYGGRILADVYIGGRDVGNALIANDLAVEYHGTGPRKDWCQ